MDLWVVDILLPDHVGLPYVLDLAVHLDGFGESQVM